MIVTPRPGVHRENLLKALREVHTAVSNLWSGGGPGPAQQRLAEYLEWVTNTVRQLGNQLAAADLDQLVLTPGYGRLLSITGTMTGTEIATQRVLNGMVSLELGRRVEDLATAIKDLEEQGRHWGGTPGVLAVADTSFYIQHPDKLEEVDFRPLLGIRAEPVRLLVPIIIVDELDGLKKSRQERWRPAYTLGVIDRVLAYRPGRPSWPRRISRPWAMAGYRAVPSPLSWCSTPLATSGCRSTMTRSSTGSWRPRCWRAGQSRC